MTGSLRIVGRFGFTQVGEQMDEIDGLELVTGPDLAAVGVELDDSVERLHRRVR